MAWGTKLKHLQTSHDAALLQNQPHYKKIATKRPLKIKPRTQQSPYMATSTKKHPERKALHDNKDQTPLLASHATAHPSPFSATEQMTKCVKFSGWNGPTGCRPAWDGPPTHWKGTHEALETCQRYRLLPMCYHVALFPVKPERATCASHACPCILCPNYHYSSSPCRNTYFCSSARICLQRLLALSVVALHTGLAMEEPGFGSWVPVGNEVS